MVKKNNETNQGGNENQLLFPSTKVDHESVPLIKSKVALMGIGQLGHAWEVDDNNVEVE